MTHKVSVLLPSLRPELLARSIREFSECHPTFDYEIVVVSPFEVRGINTRWVKEEIKAGSVLATNFAFCNSSGEYVVYFSDDVSPTPNCLEIMYENMRDTADPSIGAFKMMTSINGREIGPFGAYNKFYACYGCMSKKTIYELGGYFDPNFMYSWADIDISLRCWEKNGLVFRCDEAIVLPRQENDSIYQEHRSKWWDTDVETFMNKWHSKLGKGLERRDGAVNRRLI